MCGFLFQCILGTNGLSAQPLSLFVTYKKRQLGGRREKILPGALFSPFSSPLSPLPLSPSPPSLPPSPPLLPSLSLFLCFSSEKIVKEMKIRSLLDSRKANKVVSYFCRPAAGCVVLQKKNALRLF